MDRFNEWLIFYQKSMDFDFYDELVKFCEWVLLWEFPESMTHDDIVTKYLNEKFEAIENAADQD